MCNERLSRQSHYDFVLRALKSVLSCVGDLKRSMTRSLPEVTTSANSGPNDASLFALEREVLLNSTNTTVLPKLVREDISAYTMLVGSIFPELSDDANGKKLEDDCDILRLKENLKLICSKNQYICGGAWLRKCVQLWQVSQLRRGIMLVGPSG